MALLAMATPSSVRGQWTAMLDAGPAYVEYEGFLGSSAITLVPATRWTVPNASFAARGALTRFETGHTSLAGDVAGAWYPTTVGPVSVGITADGTVSRYQLAPSALRGRVGLGAQANTRDVIWWGSGTLGVLHQGAGTIGLAAVEGGGGLVLPYAALTGSVALHWVDGVPYGDGEILGRIVRGQFTLSGTAGARASHAVGGRQLWVHADIAYQIAPHISATVGGGTYPSDPSINAPGARYAAVGLHLAWGGIERGRADGIRPPAPPGPPTGNDGVPMTADLSRHDTTTTGPHPVIPTAIIDREPGHAVTFHVHAAGAHVVELSGDFTAWRPVALEPTVDGGWLIRFVLSPGAHRVNIRVDGGPWTAPAGVPQVPDDFGGTVGVFATP